MLPRHYIWLPAIIAVAGFIPLPSTATYTTAALAAAAALWYRYLSRNTSAAHKLAYVGDPAHPDTTQLQQALELALTQTSQNARPSTLSITLAHNQHTSLTLLKDGTPAILQGKQETPFATPDIWLADHPLPLTLPPGTTIHLRLTPTSSRRIRVTVQRSPRLPSRLWWLFIIGAAAAALLNYALLFAVLFAFGTTILIAEKEEQRTA